ncbi:MAG: CopG family antitoxin [Chloroflexota bacterium]|nr:CopG family antitoxin [Chloroflexota bacterium]
MEEKEGISSISKASTQEEIAEFWDTHSLADYDDQTYEVEMQFDPAARRTYVGIEPELLQEVRQIASERRVSTQTLVNLWLRQRIDQLRMQASGGAS